MSGIMSMVLGAKTAIAAAVDAYFNLVTLLLPGDGTNGAQNNTFIDSSSNNFTITRNGGNPGMTQGTFSPFSQTGWSNRLVEANNDYLTTNSSASFGISGDFTYEGWVYLTSTAFKRFIMPSSVSMNVDISQDSGNNMKLGFFDGTTVFTDSVNTFPINTWAHVAVVRSGSGTNNCSFYVNGVRGTQFTTNATNSTVSITIGKYSTNGFDGYISNLRFCKSAVYSGSTYTVPTSPLTTTSQGATNCVLLTCQDNRFVDNSSTAATLTPTGTPSVQAFSPFAPTAAYSASTNGGSGYFDGTGDWLALPSSSNLALGSGDFCVETWIYQTTAASAGIIGNSTSAGDGDTQYELQIGSSPYYPRFIGWTSVFLTSSTAITINQWNHLAVCRSGTTCSMFLNGTRVATGTVSQNFSSTNALNIGRQAAGTAALAGYLSGTRIVKGSSVYSPSSTTITVPTAPLTAVTNTQLLTNFTNAGITDATAKNDLETVGNAQISTTQSKFGGSSMYFDGTGDRLVAPTSQNTAFRTGDFTIEFWAYPTSSTSTFRSFIDTRSGSVNTGISIWQNGTSLEIYGSAQQLAATSALTVNAWQHIAVTRASNTVRAFVNGTQVGSSYTNSNDMTDTRLVIADDNTSTYPFVGYLDDFRITKGYARYTANFTAPTSAFALQ